REVAEVTAKIGKKNIAFEECRLTSKQRRWLAAKFPRLQHAQRPQARASSSHTGAKRTPTRTGLGYRCRLQRNSHHHRLRHRSRGAVGIKKEDSGSVHKIFTRYG
ncbi:hypothetical protein L914_13912, partial [Phytophthora nicotianae]